MHRRLFGVALAVSLTWLVGCSDPPPQDRDANNQLHPGIEKFRSKIDRDGAPRPAEVRAWFARGSDNSATAIRALAMLLHHPDPQVRGDAAYLLGYLGDEAARSVLAEALGDSAAQVRLAACSALNWIKPGNAVEPMLIQLCKLDPSTKVRVAAAEALGRDDEAAIEAFRLGLADENEDTRERCETALERLNKLILPLPEVVYQVVQRQQYEQWKESGRVQRQAMKNGTVYFEIVERIGMRPPSGAICAIGAKRHWYCAKVD
jgi:hypothetical protein